MSKIKISVEIPVNSCLSLERCVEVMKSSSLFSRCVIQRVQKRGVEYKVSALLDYDAVSAMLREFLKDNARPELKLCKSEKSLELGRNKRGTR